jgi:hypothetical protein
MDCRENGFQSGHAKYGGFKRSALGRYSRLVDRLTIHGEYLSFRELCEKVISDSTDYLVLDLDRTFHYGRNMGERFGWEIIGYQIYGEDFIRETQARQLEGRALLLRNRPLATFRYLLRGARLWAYPGLLYLFCVKIGMKYRASRRWVYEKFGVEAVEEVQQVPRIALMHQQADLPKTKLKELAEGLWHRHKKAQVIFPKDIAWLKQRFSGLKIIISSASPQPVLEVVRDSFEVDDIIYTSIEERDGYFSSPHVLDPLFLRFNLPRRIAPPKAFFQNASLAKISKLVERYPDICDEKTETVGITDTSHGEDHSWARYFTKVVDINSPAPFGPIISSFSPLQEIHSAHVLTAGELELRSQGVEDYLNPGRPKLAEAGEKKFLDRELEDLVEPVRRKIEELAEKFEQQAAALGERRQELLQKAAEQYLAIEQAVEKYNESLGRERKRALRWLKKHLRYDRSLRRKMLRLERKLARLQFEIENLIAESRSLIEGPRPEKA